MIAGPVDEVRRLVDGIRPIDDVSSQHRTQALTWLGATDDIYRRARPRTPSPHLVSYFLLVDRRAARVLLCDHRLAGLWLPTGGHVEPGEHPADTVRREVVEELGIDAEFDAVHGANPFFVTVTDTVGAPADRHTDVTLWFALAGVCGQPLVADAREFTAVRWFGRDDVLAVPTSRIEPHLLRALDVLEQPERGI